MGELHSYILIFLIGAVASFINIMAGGGSVLTLGLLMMLGCDASVANGTNRLGVLVGCFTGLVAYKSENHSGFKDSLKLTLFAIPGAILGTFFAINVSNVVFQRILSLVMIFVIVSLFIPKDHKKQAAPHQKRQVFIYPAMFLVGIYGGFIQAGVGFLIMAALRHLWEMRLVKINMHKNFIVFLYTCPAIIIFALTKNIHWPYAACLALGNICGAWVSVKTSIQKGDRIVKIILGVAILLMALKFMLTF